MTKTSRGFVAPLSMILMFILILLGLTAVKISASSYLVVSNDMLETHAQLAADAGIQDGIQYLSANPSWTAPSTQTQVMNDTTEQLRTTYQLTLTNGSGSDKILRSTGRTFRMPDLSNPVASRTYEVVLSKSNGALNTGTHSIITGYGGLVADEIASIMGNVYIEGQLHLKSQTKIETGPGKAVEVAGNGCGNLSWGTYPSMCASNPIKIDGIYSTNPDSAHIKGAVSANNQTNGAKMTDPGLTGNPVTVRPLPPPPDRQPIKDAITVTMSSSDPSSPASKDYCAVTGAPERILPPNVKIEGMLSDSDNCPIVISGNVWVTSHLTISRSVLKIAEGVIEKPIVMVDGRITTAAYGAIMANSSGVGGRFISYATSAPCWPDCTTVPQSRISYDIKAGDPDPNHEADAEVRIFSMPYPVPYAYYPKYYDSEFMSAWGTVYVQTGTDASVGAVAGQKVYLEGATKIGHDGTTITTGGSSSGSVFSIKSHRRVF